jgi:hypothetical protein
MPIPAWCAHSSPQDLHACAHASSTARVRLASLADCFRTHADALQVSYVIWQGQIWTAGGTDTASGWGRPYNGGGVYDPDEATGGHFDHLHVSFRQ